MLGYPSVVGLQIYIQGSDLNQIVNGMFSHTKTQIENLTLANSRFIFNEVLSMDIDFHQLNLTRGSSYLPLPDWLVNKRAIINPKNKIDECFKWAVIAALHHEEIISHPERILNLTRFKDNDGWSGWYQDKKPPDINPQTKTPWTKTPLAKNPQTKTPQTKLINTNIFYINNFLPWSCFILLDQLTYD